MQCSMPTMPKTGNKVCHTFLSVSYSEFLKFSCMFLLRKWVIAQLWKWCNKLWIAYYSHFHDYFWMQFMSFITFTFSKITGVTYLQQHTVPYLIPQFIKLFQQKALVPVRTWVTRAPLFRSNVHPLNALFTELHNTALRICHTNVKIFRVVVITEINASIIMQTPTPRHWTRGHWLSNQCIVTY